DVALDDRRLGDDAHRVPELRADLEAAAGQPQRGLERLVAVGDPTEDHQLSLPGWFPEGLPEQLGRTALHDDLGVEVGPGAEAEVLVTRPRVAVGAGVHAAPVGVHAEVEADVGAIVGCEDSLRRVVPDVDRSPWVVLLEVLERRRGEGVRRIRPGPGLHPGTLS